MRASYRDVGREGAEREAASGLEQLFLHFLSFPLRSMARGAGRAYLYPTLGPVTAVARSQAGEKSNTLAKNREA